MANATTTLQEQITKQVTPALQKELGLSTIAAVPRITKIVINVGIGKFKEDKKQVAEIAKNITAITGQKAVVTKAKKAISNFKLRAGMPVGVKVTLRGASMYHFLNKLVNVICPRIRDFRGFSPKSFDGQGNVSIGIKEHTVFPEVNPVDANKVHGVQITIHTDSNNDEHALALLRAIKFPFKKPAKKEAEATA